MRASENPAALKRTIAVTRFLGRYSSRLAGVAANRLWFTPWRVQYPERALAKQEAWLARTRPFAMGTSVGRVSGFVAGRGPTVVLVHGWGDRGANLGAFIDPLVGAGFRVVGFDLPAHGESPGETTNILDCGAAVRDVARYFGNVHAVIAHSMGASSALWALRDGLRVERVALLAPNVDIDHAMDMFEFLFELPPKAIQGLRATIERQFGRDVWTDLRAEEIAKEIDLPALVIHDRDDTQIAHADAQRLVKSWPSADLVSTEGLGHARVVRDPSVIARVVEFLGGEERPEMPTTRRRSTAGLSCDAA